jgi:hypothetical protein
MWSSYIYYVLFSVTVNLDSFSVCWLIGPSLCWRCLPHVTHLSDVCLIIKSFCCTKSCHPVSGCVPAAIPAEHPLRSLMRLRVPANVGKHLQAHTASQPRRRRSTSSKPSDSQILVWKLGSEQRKTPFCTEAPLLGKTINPRCQKTHMSSTSRGCNRDMHIDHKLRRQAQCSQTAGTSTVFTNCRDKHSVHKLQGQAKCSQTAGTSKVFTNCRETHSVHKLGRHAGHSLLTKSAVTLNGRSTNSL